MSRADQLADPSHVRAWLHRIVRNLIADELRRLDVGPILADIDEMDLSIAPDEEPACWCVLAQLETLKREYADILRRVVIDGDPR